MKFGFYLPAAGKILLTPLRHSPYDEIGSFLSLFLPHRNKRSFVLKVIGAVHRSPLPLGARACGYPIFFWNLRNEIHPMWCGRQGAGRKISGRPKGERCRAEAGVPQAEGGRNEKYRFRF